MMKGSNMRSLRVWRKRRGEEPEFVGIFLGVSAGDDYSDLMVVRPDGGVTHVNSNEAIVEYPHGDLEPSPKKGVPHG